MSQFLNKPPDVSTMNSERIGDLEGNMYILSDKYNSIVTDYNKLSNKVSLALSENKVAMQRIDVLSNSELGLTWSMVSFIIIIMLYIRYWVFNNW